MHATATSLTSYPILFPSTISSMPPSRAPTPRGMPNLRVASSAFPSPLLRSTTPTPSEPALRGTHSFTSLRDAANEPVLPRPEKGFAKFLAARRVDWSGKRQNIDGGSDESQIGIGEGVEVERDGYGAWNFIRMNENGEGVGVAEDAVDVGQFPSLGTRLIPHPDVPLRRSETTGQGDNHAEGWKGDTRCCLFRWLGECLYRGRGE